MAATRSILLPFGLFYDRLVHVLLIWYIYPHFGMLHQLKSGNPGLASDVTFGITKLKSTFAAVQQDI
jgi:hypothetical protein